MKKDREMKNDEPMESEHSAFMPFGGPKSIFEGLIQPATDEFIIYLDEDPGRAGPTRQIALHVDIPLPSAGEIGTFRVAELCVRFRVVGGVFVPVEVVEILPGGSQRVYYMLESWL